MTDVTIAWLGAVSNRRKCPLEDLRKLFRMKVFPEIDVFSRAEDLEKYPIVLIVKEFAGKQQQAIVKQIKRASPQIVVIVVTSGEVGVIDRLSGCYYLPLPAENKQTNIFLRQFLQLMMGCYHPLRRTANAPDAPVIAESAVFKSTLAYVRKIAAFDENVLITGETGTGKDMLARYLHRHSFRAAHPCQIVNCAAISPELFESEFFGHTRGAFTGAAREKVGHFVIANQGTLVLDEITEMDRRFQVKLLRAIENQEVYPVGSQQVVRLNLRIVALSNRNLPEMIRLGKFRADLFYRLNKYNIPVPSLSEREGDIQPLVEYFLENSWYALLNNWQENVDPKIYGYLQKLRLAGNVRDLQNLVLKVLSYKTPANIYLTREDFERIVIKDSYQFKTAAAGEDLIAYLQRMEYRKIITALDENDQNITRAARQLGVSRQNLQYRLRRLRRNDLQKGA